MHSNSPAAPFAAHTRASQRPPDRNGSDSRPATQAVSYSYRGHTVTPIAGTTSYGQPKVRISGPIVNQNKAAENARICIDGHVNLAERDAIRADLPPVISEESRRAALADWGKRHRVEDPILSAAWSAAFGRGVA